jgi:hypothetical protein
MDSHILKNMEEGVLGRWCTTTFFAALCGSSHNLLPRPMPLAEYRAAKISGELTVTEDQAFYLNKHRTIRNAEDGHYADLSTHTDGSTRMSTPKFECMMAEAREFLRVCAPGCRKELEAELEQILTEEQDLELEHERVGELQLTTDHLRQTMDTPFVRAVLDGTEKKGLDRMRAEQREIADQMRAWGVPID